MNDATPMGFPSLGGPYKCPDCGVWWAGFEHRCPTIITETKSNLSFGHCHGCITVRCHQNDHQPCMLHEGGWTISESVSVSALSL